MSKNVPNGLFFSIVIPSYNSSKQIKRAVESVIFQNFNGCEIIIVDDASTDNSHDILGQLEASYDNLTVHYKEKNNGTLSARAKGVNLARGKYILLLDQDDELASGCLEHLKEQLLENPVDILHFGTEVIPHNDLAKEAKEDAEAWVNPKSRVLTGKDILAKQFAIEDGFDWNVHHKVFEASLAKKAWGPYEDEFLCYADDLLISFILCCYARTYRAIADSKWYLYHLGAGETLSGEYTFDNFVRVNSLDATAFKLVKEFVLSHEEELPRDDYKERLFECEERLVSHVMNEIYDHMDFELFNKCINEIMDDWSITLIATDLWRFVRHHAYMDFINKSGNLQTDRILRMILKCALKITDQVENYYYPRLAEMKDRAVGHLNDLKAFDSYYELSRDIEDEIASIIRSDSSIESSATTSKENGNDLRIFVACHKEADTFKSNLLMPIQVGAKNAKQKFSWCTPDDSGDNISDLNPMYCELTAQYWAWKNVDCDMYGLCHYRRYFNFSDTFFKENQFGEVIDFFIDKKTQKKYNLTNEGIVESLKGYDLVTTRFQDLTALPGSFHNPKEHWEDAPFLQNDDLDLLEKIIEERHPDYIDTYRTYMANNKTCFGNMFIMKKSIFNQYCEWLFDILGEFEKRYDPQNYSKEALRTIGHLGERLLNVFILKLKHNYPDLKHKELQCVHFERPDKLKVAPCSLNNPNKKTTIPVVLAADDFYVPVLTTAIYSAVENASTDFNYDIIVFHSNIHPENQMIMKNFFRRYNHVSLRFIEVDRLVDKCRLTTANEHISNETYYRFLIQALLPEYDKVLYLDSDLIVEGDISELYCIDLGDNIIAAVKDIDYLGNLNYKDGWRRRYSKDILLMDNPFNYFQAGVLVMNTKEMRALHKVDTWLFCAADRSYIYNDQDILNSECEHRVSFLPSEWNVMHDCKHRVGGVFAFAPAKIFEDYLEARKNPKIIHFAGVQKPWKYENVDMEEYFWKYARNTPFIQKIIERRIIWVEKWQIQDALDQRFERHQHLYHPLMNLPAKAARIKKDKKGH